MRKKSVLSHRVYVRRSAPSPAVWLSLFMVLALGAFVFFARPILNQTALDMDQAPVTSERVTRDVSFDALSLYMVELTRIDDPTNARIEAARYVPRGAAGYIYTLDGAYLVIGAGYATAAEAEKVAAQLTESEGIAAKVHALSGDNVGLRVTATEAQLSALIEGEQALRALTSAMAAHALSLDRAEAQPAAMRAALAIEAEQAHSASTQLTRAAGDQPNSVAKALIEQLSTFTEVCRRLAAEDADTALILSSKLKYAHLDARMNHIAFLNALMP